MSMLHENFIKIYLKYTEIEFLMYVKILNVISHFDNRNRCHLTCHGLMSVHSTSFGNFGRHVSSSFAKLYAPREHRSASYHHVIC